MGLPLSRVPDPDSEPNRPTLLPDGPSGQKIVDRDNWPGLAYLVAATLACATGGYASGYIVEFWPWMTAPLLTLGPVAALGAGVLLVRRGVGNPAIRKFERWRKVSFDWKDRALQAEAELDQVAQRFTGEHDPATARRLMHERLERLKKGRGPGRPRGSRTGIDQETWREKAREIHKLRRQGMTWDNIGMRFGIDGDTAREWYRCLEAKDSETA